MEVDADASQAELAELASQAAFNVGMVRVGAAAAAPAARPPLKIGGPHISGAAFARARSLSS
jgi:hypothetical protein